MRWLNLIYQAGLRIVLAFVMKIEFVLLKLGLRLPFGGSLLIIARKA